MSIAITSVEFKNFKAFTRYSLSIQSLNILVGPNNCGKSTILGAFRALSSGLRRARTKGPELVMGPQGQRFGYSLTQDNLPISIENVHTDYADSETLVTFRLSNKNRLILFFPKDGGCALIPETEGRAVRTAAAFKSAFPITLAVVPVLGPVEHEETVLQSETVQRHLMTHRASRHFRNYWHYFPEGFDSFAELVKATWPGMEIQRPEIADWYSRKLAMFCLEKRMTRELYWAGFGFQIWCQLLTHISRASSDTILVVDEPEIYLHPDVQRQLLGILREAGPDVLMATHSSEIIAEADPSEILLIDKARQSARRLRDVGHVQAVLDLVGSIQNITLTQLARNRRVLFVEGLGDFVVLRRFARQLGFAELAAGTGITPVESGGFGSWERVGSAAWGVEKALGQPLRIAAVFDRDFRCDEEIDRILASLGDNLSLVHIHSRKEIENYLLVPSVLDRALRRALGDRKRRTGGIDIKCPNVVDILDRVTAPFKTASQSQYIARRNDYLATIRAKTDQATTTAETLVRFNAQWDRLDLRMQIVPGKEVLAAFRDEVQRECGVTLSDSRIIDAFHEGEIPLDLAEFLRRLETFRIEE